MKNLTLITTLFVLFIAFEVDAQDTIPNNNFENWQSTTDPSHWSTVNELLPFGFSACFQSTDAYEGEFALFMKTIDLDGLLVPGVASLGTIGMGFSEGGVPFKARPESLTGYFKHPSSDDMVMLAAEFYRNGEEIGSAYWATADSVSEYTLFTVPVTFYTTEEPDTLNITILTDQNVLGSTLTLDALSFNFPPVQVKELKSDRIKIYPNPCFDYLHFSSDKNIEAIQVLAMSGHIVLEKQHSAETSKIDLQELPKGMYIARFISGDYIFHQKIMKN
jgi:hypothetical protein